MVDFQLAPDSSIGEHSQFLWCFISRPKVSAGAEASIHIWMCSEVGKRSKSGQLLRMKAVFLTSTAAPIPLYARSMHFLSTVYPTYHTRYSDEEGELSDVRLSSRGWESHTISEPLFYTISAKNLTQFLTQFLPNLPIEGGSASFKFLWISFASEEAKTFYPDHHHRQLQYIQGFWEFLKHPALSKPESPTKGPWTQKGVLPAETLKRPPKGLIHTPKYSMQCIVDRKFLW